MFPLFALAWAIDLCALAFEMTVWIMLVNRDEWKAFTLLLLVVLWRTAQFVARTVDAVPVYAATERERDD